MHRLLMICKPEGLHVLPSGLDLRSTALVQSLIALVWGMVISSGKTSQKIQISENINAVRAGA